MSDAAGQTAAETAALQAQATEAYRRSPYPAAIHALTHPDRFAAIARLAGMDPPDVRTARILDVGTGSGANLLSIAQTLPHARCVGIDIDPDAIAKGQGWARAAGLTNARLEVADLLDGAPAINGEFDYIIAHGVYAWVPEPVAEALLRLIADRLTPRGVAYISFNALPGCYSRMPLRDAMLRAAAGATTDAERLERAHRVLARMAKARSGDGPLETGLRHAAKTKLEQSPAVLIHDELGPVYRPRHLQDVLGRAGVHGLKYLSDASFDLVMEGLLSDADAPADERQALVERRACDGDDTAFRQFRRLLLVRADADVPRVIDPAVIASFFASRSNEEVEPNVFAGDLQSIRCDHAPLADALRRLFDVYPTRIRIADLGLDPIYLPPLVGLFDCGILHLHTHEGVAVSVAGERPMASPLARVLLGEGQQHLPNLDHRLATLNDGLAQALGQIDGRPVGRDLSSIAQVLEATPQALLAGFAKAALLLR